MKASRTRYSIVALAIGLAILSYVQRVAISQAAGPISHDLHLNKAQMGLVFGAFGLSYALFEVPIGLLGDKIGVRRVLLQIVLGWSAFTALTGAAWNFVSLWVIRFLFGAGEAGCFPILTRMLSMWLPARERVTAQSLLWAFARWGGAATPPLVLACIALIGWRFSFVAFAGLGLVWCAVFWFWYKDNPRQHTSVNDAEKELLETSRVLMTHHAGQKKWLSLLAYPGSAGSLPTVLLRFVYLVLLHHLAANVFTRGAGSDGGPRGGFVCAAFAFRRHRFVAHRARSGACAAP